MMSTPRPWQAYSPADEPTTIVYTVMGLTIVGGDPNHE